MIAVLPISCTDVKDQPELLAEYDEECRIASLGKADPQWPMYEHMERAGMMHVFGAYDDRVMVGFCVMLAYVTPHYGYKVAVQESLFVSKRYRRTLAGARLMVSTGQWARLAGCKKLGRSAIAGSELEAVLEKRHPRDCSVFWENLC